MSVYMVCNVKGLNFISQFLHKFLNNLQHVLFCLLFFGIVLQEENRRVNFHRVAEFEDRGERGSALCEGNGKCPRCLGSGHNGLQTCYECAGSGICPQCHGSGEK